MVYSRAGEDTDVLSGRTTHAVRAFAASWAFFKNVSLSDILKACSWKAQSTFASFYLKDMTLMKEDLHVLGPLVVAQNRV